MLDFTPTEKRGIVITIAIIIIAAVIQWVKPNVYHQESFDYSGPDSVFYRSSQMSAASFVSDHQATSKSKIRVKKRSSTPAPASINLNTATKSELEKLPRIGPKTAQRIIEFRDNNAGFRKNEDLMLVKGIGPKTFENIKPYLKDLK